jgi:hypothetical protein
LGVEIFEKFAQAGAGAVDPGLHGRDRGVHDLGDLLVGEFLLHHEQDGRTLLGGELEDGALEGFVEFGDPPDRPLGLVAGLSRELQGGGGLAAPPPPFVEDEIAAMWIR